LGIVIVVWFRDDKTVVKTELYVVGDEDGKKRTSTVQAWFAFVGQDQPIVTVEPAVTEVKFPVVMGIFGGIADPMVVPHNAAFEVVVGKLV